MLLFVCLQCLFNTNLQSVCPAQSLQAFVQHKTCRVFVQREACRAFVQREACRAFVQHKACRVFVQRKAQGVCVLGCFNANLSMPKGVCVCWLFNANFETSAVCLWCPQTGPRHAARPPPMFPGSRGPDPPRGGYCSGPGGVVFRFFHRVRRSMAVVPPRRERFRRPHWVGVNLRRFPAPVWRGVDPRVVIVSVGQEEARGVAVVSPRRKRPPGSKRVTVAWVSCCVALSCVRCSSFVCFHLPQYWDGRNAVTSPRGMQSRCACHGFVPFVEVSFHESFFVDAWTDDCCLLVFCRCMD